MTQSNEHKAWSLDQLAKSAFFHQKLHDWGMMEVMYAIEQVRGEDLEWNLEALGISQKAWDKIIHRGIKPVIIFAHPEVLQSILRAVSYYRMLALVSQKSMKRVKLNVDRFEQEDTINNRRLAKSLAEKAPEIAKHLNGIISTLVEFDEEIDAREFDLWRGMAAGSQAQGSWQNAKGDKLEIVIKGVILSRLRERDLLVSKLVEVEVEEDVQRFELRDGRSFEFSDEPDVAVVNNGVISAAVEIKGGIDVAGVLERIGAAIKSLIRAKHANPQSTTILLLQGVSVTPQARDDLRDNQASVNYWFTIEDILEDEGKREELFSLLQI